MIRKEDIEKTVSAEDIFRKYIRHNFKIGVPFLSELQPEKHPSADVFRSNTGTLLYKDFREAGALNCYGYVMRLYGTDFPGALKIIANDFGIQESSEPVSEALKLPKLHEAKVPTVYSYEIKFWEQHELDFWARFGIVQEALDEYEVYPLYWVQAVKGDKIYPARESSRHYPIFLIKIGEHEKIYFPFADNPRYKWLSNTNAKDIFGLRQAIKAAEDEKLSMLGLIAGQKDLLSLYSSTGIRAIALSSEGGTLQFSTYLQMSEIAEWLFILYDNDRTGIRAMNKIASSYPIIPIYLNKFLRYSTLKDSSGINDVADWYEYKRVNNLNKDRLLNLIEYEKSTNND